MNASTTCIWISHSGLNLCLWKKPFFYMNMHWCFSWQNCYYTICDIIPAILGIIAPRWDTLILAINPGRLRNLFVEVITYGSTSTSSLKVEQSIDIFQHRFDLVPESCEKFFPWDTINHHCSKNAKPSIQCPCPTLLLGPKIEMDTENLLLKIYNKD